jgi:hypothetical protein
MNLLNFVYMRRSLHLVIFFLFTASLAYSQLHVVKPVKTRPKKTNFAIGFGVSQSVVYLTRNVNSNNDARGLNVSMLYGITRGLRLCAEYSLYRSLDIAPTWYGINAHTIEVNIQPLLRFNNRRAYFYPLLGWSYNIFKGFYTGTSDAQSLFLVYQKNTVIRSSWLGFNAGLGYEFYFRPGSFFATYKMRVGKAEGSNLNIMDVCITAGLRFNIKVPTFYNLFRGTRSRYILDVPEAD